MADSSKSPEATPGKTAGAKFRVVNPIDPGQPIVSIGEVDPNDATIQRWAKDSGGVIIAGNKPGLSGIGIFPLPEPNSSNTKSKTESNK